MRGSAGGVSSTYRVRLSRMGGGGGGGEPAVVPRMQTLLLALAADPSAEWD